MRPLSRLNQAPAKPFLTRLAGDTRGNTLAIVGAALIPLTAMIGSGVDMSRAYMAKARLQSACDAASLAGRRVMTNDTLSQAVKDETTEFFRFNFPNGTYGTEPVALEITKPDTGTVHVAADTSIPTGIMHLFGFDSLPLSVACEAAQNFVNTDIILVLDTTGSMRADINGKSTWDDSKRKITALREAVMALYDELAPIQTELEKNGLRLRYGIVPYSSSVNVGHLIQDVDENYLRGTAPYQSRRINTFTTNLETKCTDSPYYGSYNSSTGVCSYYSYEQQTIDTSSYLAGNAVNLTPIIGGSTPGSNKAVYSASWKGCIEERQTVPFAATASYNIPNGAYDLNADLIPDSDATRWVPHWPEVIYPRDAGSVSQNLRENGYYDGKSIIEVDEEGAGDGGFYACPSEARRLQAWTRTDLKTYVDDLEAVGGTYHDIGMIWGARFISSGGIFADSPETHNGLPVARHVIFMTDGQLAPNPNSYTSYGIEQHDRRVVANNVTLNTYPTPTNQHKRHSLRFRMMCNATKGMNVSIWVIAFGTSLNDDLTDCASSSSQASVSSDKEDLIDKFKEIGKNIGALRLTQ